MGRVQTIPVSLEAGGIERYSGSEECGFFQDAARRVTDVDRNTLRHLFD